jgi:hypothetical protein
MSPQKIEVIENILAERKEVSSSGKLAEKQKLP